NYQIPGRARHARKSADRDAVIRTDALFSGPPVAVILTGNNLAALSGSSTPSSSCHVTGTDTDIICHITVKKPAPGRVSSRRCDFPRAHSTHYGALMRAPSGTA